MSDQESTRFSRAYHRGYNDGYDRPRIIGSVAHGLTPKVIAFTEDGAKEQESYNAGWDAGVSDQREGKPHAFRPATEPEPARPVRQYRTTSEVAESSSSSDSDSSEGMNPIVAVVLLFVIAGVLYAIYWLSVNLVLPLLLLNSALWLTIYALIAKRRKTLFFALAFAGGAYLLFDITKGWLSQNFVRNVTSDPAWLDGFVWVNAVALGLAAWFLTKGLRRSAQEVWATDTSQYQLKLSGAVSSIVVAATALPLVHYIMKPDPEGDAKLIAVEQCNCVEQYNKRLAEAGQQFLTSFDTYQFKTRAAARTAYVPVYNAANEALNTCTATAQAKLTSKQAEHRSNHYYGKTLKRAFEGLTGFCSPDQSVRAGLDQKVHELVETITEPRPDLERMKADLIGRTIPNWTFKGLSDFASVIDSTASVSDTRFESHLTMDLNDPESRSPTAKLVLIYNLRDGQWWLDQTDHKEVVYHLTVTNEAWYKWPVPKGANYTFTSGKIFVVTDHSYRRIKCGPDIGGQTIPHSRILQFASREKNASASIRFTFKPKEN